jgi:hypothetical protein
MSKTRKSHSSKQLVGNKGPNVRESEKRHKENPALQDGACHIHETLVLLAYRPVGGRLDVSIEKLDHN